MYTKSLGYMKASLAVLLTFLLGIITTALVAKAYDQAAINTRAQKMVDAIKTNASKLDPVQVQPYYALVILNLRSLSMVLAEVDKQLATAADTSVLAGLLPPASSGTNNTSNNTNTNNSNTNNTNTNNNNNTNNSSNTMPPKNTNSGGDTTTPPKNTNTTPPKNTNSSGGGGSSGGGSSGGGSYGGGSSGGGSSGGGSSGGGSCKGNKPTGPGYRFIEYSTAVAGPSSGPNTTWMHSSSVPANYAPTCTWSCTREFEVSPDKSSCQPRPAGSGINIVLKDQHGKPVPGVRVRLTSFIASVTNQIGGGTSDASGRIPEFFGPNSDEGNLSSPHTNFYLFVESPGYFLKGGDCKTYSQILRGRCELNHGIVFKGGVANIEVIDVASTDPNIVFLHVWSQTPTNTLIGNDIFARVTGGNPRDTYGCITGYKQTDCSNRSNWWKIGWPGDPFGTWRIGEHNGLLEFRGDLSRKEFPSGTYTYHVANGREGKSSSTIFVMWETGAIFGKSGHERIVSPAACAKNNTQLIVKGINAKDRPFGCMTKKGNTHTCKNASEFRPFTLEELPTGSETITINVPGGTFPPDVYTLHLYYQPYIPEDISKIEFVVGDWDVSKCDGVTGGNNSQNPNFVPRTVYTKDSGLTQQSSTYTIGETLYGYIDMNGGNIDDVYGCVTTPNGGNCGPSGDGWEKLWNGGWVINRAANRIEFRGGLHLADGYPTGQWVGYTRQGQNGQVSQTAITVLPKRDTHTPKPSNTSGGPAAPQITGGTFPIDGGRTVRWECGYPEGSRPSGDGWVQQEDKSCYHKLLP